MTGPWPGIVLLILVAFVLVVLLSRSLLAGLVTLAICAAAILGYGLVVEAVQEAAPAPMVTDVQLPTLSVTP